MKTFTAQQVQDILALHKDWVLSRPNGVRADFSCAYLRGAYLRGAYLRGADLRGADLRGADLRGAYLSGADLRDDLVLVGDRPLITIGPIGTEQRTVFGWLTNEGLRVQAGCFFGTEKEFKQQLNATRGGTAHETEYLAALTFIKVHAKLWTPAKAKAVAA